VRVEDSRWEVEEFRNKKWRPLGFWDPILTIESIANGLKVVREGQTTNGTLKVELIQPDGGMLKHRIIWTNTSGTSKTVRVG